MVLFASGCKGNQTSSYAQDATLHEQGCSTAGHRRLDGRMIYFKTYARENGCPEELFGSDLAIWNWIREYQVITVWESLIDEENDIWDHNHISKGYDASVTIPPHRTVLQQKAWKGKKWRGTKASLSCYNVVGEAMEPIVV